MGQEKAVGIVTYAIDARDCSERNAIERFNLDRSVVTRNTQSCEDIVDVVYAIGRNNDVLALG